MSTTNPIIPRPGQVWRNARDAWREVLEVGSVLIYYRTARSLEMTATHGAWAAWVERTHATCQA